MMPCTVSAENGPIKPGDMLVASTVPGYAMRAGANPPVGSVIGKALGRFDKDKGTCVMGVEWKQAVILRPREAAPRVILRLPEAAEESHRGEILPLRYTQGQDDRGITLRMTEGAGLRVTGKS